MPNIRLQRFEVAELQPDNAPAGNGTPAEATGANGVVVFADAGGTPGTVVLEYSRDNVNWEDYPIYSAATGDSISNTITENLIVIGEVFDGQWYIRARIPETWAGVGAPLVQVVFVR